MKVVESSSSRRVALSHCTVAAAALAVFCGALWGGAAWAVPSFARQTGLECAVCHVAFPELTPTGRAFKLGGYVRQGGDSELPHLAVVAQETFTHTQVGQPGGAAPHYAANNNPAFEAASLFYGGALDTDIGLGTLTQVTYNGVTGKLGWDNTDVRLAHTAQIGDRDFIFGFTVNNNPTVQDVWNTTPAFRFPFVTSPVAPAPAAATLIDGGLGQSVLGAGAYGYWDDLVYGEVSLYRTLGARALNELGAPTVVPDIDGVAPYWRLAVEPHRGKHSLEVGTFGLAAQTFPQRVMTNGTDRRIDLGVDTQYQFIGDRDQVSLQLSWIHEDAQFNASQPLGLTANLHDKLSTFNAKASYFYDHTYGINLSYFATEGTTDPVLFAPAAIAGSANGSPNSSGWLIEANYLPFMHGGPEFWPWLNVRFAVQYRIFDKFNGGRVNYDGAGRNASDNNTLFLLAWLAF